MGTERLEAFSDGVIAIIITISVLELHVPHGTHLEDLRPVWPVFLTYVLSFVYVGIYWNNHHHLLRVTRRITGGVLWANLHLLFWLSLLPFVTGWMGQNHFASLPTAIYGLVLLMGATAYEILQRTIIACQEPDSPLERAMGRDLKAKVSSILYASAIPLAFVRAWIADAIFLVVALTWLVPDRRIERIVKES